MGKPTAPTTLNLLAFLLANFAPFFAAVLNGGPLCPVSSSSVSSSPKSMKISFLLGVLAYIDCVYSTLRILFCFFSR